jgi:dTDP-4-dehydrorhamnose 3,5-epimerase
VPVNVKMTALEGVLLITPKRFGDDRGFFEETWSARDLKAQGIALDFVQDNHSYSAPVGTLRGLHFQAPPHAQDKLVRCTRGAIFDVAVDIRVGSPTYGQWVGEELSRENGKQLLVPKGFLHGFLTLVSDTEVQYKCTDYYAPECDGAVAWDSLGIAWPLPAEQVPVLSPKDTEAQAFADFVSPFRFGERL